MTRSPRLAKPLAHALKAHEAWVARRARGSATALANARYRAIAALIQELGLDRATHPTKVMAAELDEDRRDVLAELTRHGISVRSVAELPDVWQMRRLVGLVPPGILEELGLGWGSTRAFEETLAEVPASRRVEAYVEASLTGRDVWKPSFFASLRADAPAALAYARATLPLLAPDEHVLARAALFTAFSASGTTVPEGADERFPLAYRLPGEAVDAPGSKSFLVEHFEAIAPDRRDDVLAGIIAGPRTNGGYEAAVFLLEQGTSLPRSIAALRRRLDHALKQHLTPYEKKDLGALDKRLRAIGKGAPEKRAAASSRALEVSARRSPKRASDVDALAARQLVETGRRFDGQTLPAARRLSLDENDEAAIGALLEHVTLSEGGRPVFQAWLHGDAGVFFVAGTCDVVAERGDGVTALEASEQDEPLARALAAIGRSKASVRSVADVGRATRATRSAAPKKKAKPKAKAKKKPVRTSR